MARCDGKMAKTKLNDELIRDISMYRGHGMSWRKISLKTGICSATIRAWLTEGKEATRANNIKKRLYHAVGEAEASLIYEAAALFIRSTC